MSRLLRRLGPALVVSMSLALGAIELGAQELLSWAAMQHQVLAREPSPSARISYGPGPHRFGELQLPPGPGPHPVAIVIHGGCWLSIADLSYVRPLAAELNRQGWATWTLEFNRIDQDEGSWPGILEDVATGADHLRGIAREYPLDLDRVVTVGHSSGGHLALWLAARPGLDARESFAPRGEAEPLAIRGVVGLAPVTGLEDFQARSDRCGSDVVARLIDVDERAVSGADPDGPAGEARLESTDPGRMLPLGVAQLMIFGAEDGIVPAAHGDAWRRRGAAVGDEVQLRVVPGAGHFEVVAPWTASWEHVGPAIRTFLSAVEAGA